MRHSYSQNPSNGANVGRFIAGNDDFNGLASSVTVPAPTTSRIILVIVRAYSSVNGGTCDISGSNSSGWSFKVAGFQLGGARYFAGDLPVNSHITTARLPGATMDTLLLAVSGLDASHASGTEIAAVRTRSPGPATSAWPMPRHDGAGTSWLSPADEVAATRTPRATSSTSAWDKPRARDR